MDNKEKLLATLEELTDLPAALHGLTAAKVSEIFCDIDEMYNCYTPILNRLTDMINAYAQDTHDDGIVFGEKNVELQSRIFARNEVARMIDELLRPKELLAQLDAQIAALTISPQQKTLEEEHLKKLKKEKRK